MNVVPCSAHVTTSKVALSCLSCNLRPVKSRAGARCRTGVPNLGYMYPHEFICLSQGVHLMISIEEQNIFAYNIVPNIYTHISEYSFLKSFYGCC